MDSAASATPTKMMIPPRPRETTGQLLRAMLVLSIPVLLEQVLNMLVSLTDTYLANHVAQISGALTEADVAQVNSTTAAAGAAVGTISYIMWFVGLITGAIGTGSTALISRATGARHRSLANSICGQSMILAAIAGIVLAIIFYLLATPISVVSGLEGEAREFARSYIQILSIAMPAMTILMVANACLRGAGDTFTPFVAYFFVLRADVWRVGISAARIQRHRRRDRCFVHFWRSRTDDRPSDRTR